jgi:tripartite-type tricarboxylate transporter receptor subunit TctC
VSIAVINKLGKIDTMGVAYKGIPLAMNDVMAGVVDFTFVDLGNATAQAKGGKLRPLGITVNKRLFVGARLALLGRKHARL